MVTSDIPPPRVLVADDDLSIRALLRQVLEMEGYRVELAGNGSEALALAEGRAPDLILLDVDMPGLGGYDVCARLKAAPATRLVPVLILTGGGRPDGRLSAWGVGADDFLTKPFRIHEVTARCRSLLRVKRLTDELDSAQAVAVAFSRAVEAKSPYTLGHTERVTAYALRLGEKIGIVGTELELLKRGALLHDIGKIHTPDAILNKPGKLTDAEFDVIRRHPLEGVRIVEPLRSLQDTVPYIRWHHERLDGRGYPDGLFGGSIPVGVRVLSVADVYDALSSARPYRPAMSHEMCIGILRKEAAGGGLDPELVDAFVETVTAPDPCELSAMDTPVAVGAA
ncbi:MAG TPA: HD domain-containing phosphohydrolase [Gemmataceae bacterium]|jgi:putative two-component system response regulator|nr:HD domain-containing phosphohydrolase [Gemmataceae bacterium]